MDPSKTLLIGHPGKKGKVLSDLTTTSFICVILKMEAEK